MNGLNNGIIYNKIILDSMLLYLNDVVQKFIIPDEDNEIIKTIDMFDNNIHTIHSICTRLQQVLSNNIEFINNNIVFFKKLISNINKSSKLTIADIGASIVTPTKNVSEYEILCKKWIDTVISTISNIESENTLELQKVVKHIEKTDTTKNVSIGLFNNKKHIVNIINSTIHYMYKLLALNNMLADNVRSLVDKDINTSDIVSNNITYCINIINNININSCKYIKVIGEIMSLINLFSEEVEETPVEETPAEETTEETPVEEETPVDEETTEETPSEETEEEVEYEVVDEEEEPVVVPEEETTEDVPEADPVVETEEEAPAEETIDEEETEEEAPAEEKTPSEETEEEVEYEVVDEEEIPVEETEEEVPAEEETEEDD